MQKNSDLRIRDSNRTLETCDKLVRVCSTEVWTTEAELKLLRELSVNKKCVVRCAVLSPRDAGEGRQHQGQRAEYTLQSHLCKRGEPYRLPSCETEASLSHKRVMSGA